MLIPYCRHRALTSSASAWEKSETLICVTPANLRSALPDGQQATSRQENLFSAANAKTCSKDKSGRMAVKNPSFIGGAFQLQVQADHFQYVQVNYRRRRRETLIKHGCWRALSFATGQESRLTEF